MAERGGAELLEAVEELLTIQETIAPEALPPLEREGKQLAKGGKGKTRRGGRDRREPRERSSRSHRPNQGEWKQDVTTPGGFHLQKGSGAINDSGHKLKWQQKKKGPNRMEFAARKFQRTERFGGPRQESRKPLKGDSVYDLMLGQSQSDLMLGDESYQRGDRYRSRTSHRNMISS